MPEALRIIQKEHRLLSAVVEGIAHVGRAIAAGKIAPDLRLLHAMLDYIDVYPERLHHPKEDRYLFRLIEQRSAEGAAAIADLREEHARSYPALERLRAAVRDLERGKDGAAGRFAEMAAVYSGFHWQHMRKEEEMVMPLARRVLEEADWQEIDAAFRENVELSETGARGRELRRLFRQIANLMPAPFGLGDGPAPDRS